MRLLNFTTKYKTVNQQMLVQCWSIVFDAGPALDQYVVFAGDGNKMPPYVYLRDYISY